VFTDNICNCFLSSLLRELYLSVRYSFLPDRIKRPGALDVALISLCFLVRNNYALIAVRITATAAGMRIRCLFGTLFISTIPTVVSVNDVDEFAYVKIVRQ